MTRLSACYFCGTALDESLADYPVVPDGLGADDADGRTVTLCPGCRRKLGAILDEVVDALEADATLEREEGDEPFATPAEDVLADPDDAGPGDAGLDDDGVVLDAGDETSESGAGDPENAGGPGAHTESAADATADGEPEPGTDDPDGSEASNDDGDAAERAVVEGEHDISALEYNKVMRLLQNREFPVDREEIEVVAASAYQVARSDCAKVIDLAVDRGLIAEVDGKLRKPEDA